MFRGNGKPISSTVKLLLSAVLIIGFFLAGIYFHGNTIPSRDMSQTAKENKYKNTDDDLINETLFSAVKNNNIWQVRDLLLKHPQFINAKDTNGHLLIHRAVLNHEQNMVRVLLDEGQDVNQLNQFHQTPLMLAQFFNDKVMVALLLSYGADPLIKDAQGVSVLQRTIEMGQVDVLTLLLEHGPFVVESKVWVEAIHQPNRVLEDALLKETKDVDSRQMHLTALQKMWEEQKQRWTDANHTLSLPHFWASFGDVRKLEQYKNQLNRRNQQGDYPFHEAIRSGVFHQNLANWFMSKVDLHQKTQYGYTPLLLAADLGRYRWVEWLLNHGSRIDDQTPDGETALDLAWKNRHARIVLLLKHSGCLHHSVPDHRLTMMHMAALADDQQSMKEFSNDEMTPDANGFLAADWVGRL